MIKNYFKIALRNFWRHKFFTFINIIGLSIGISAALVIYLIVHFDLTFDKFHPGGERIYRVVTNYTFGGQPFYNRGVSGPVAEAVKSEVSGVEVTVPFFSIGNATILINNKAGLPTKFKNQENIILADSRYFTLFKYNWLAGDVKTALNVPNQVVLAADQAKKYFPKLSYDQMIGRVVTYDTVKTTVMGVVEPLNLRGNTDLTFHDFISYSTGFNNDALKNQLRLTNWGGTTSSSQLFIKLTPNTGTAQVEKQLNIILKKNAPPKPSDKGNTRAFKLQPLNDIHFNNDYGTFDSGNPANKTTLYGLLVIALFLLLLGCINFINLTTAQASQRAKEIGIRKTMGSSRIQLVIQFLSETFFITFLAVIISVFIAPVILNLFKDFVSPGVVADIMHQPHLIIFLVLLTLVVSFLSGFYPALMLSGYKPVDVLKNKAGSGGSKTRNALLRKSLTVTQFVIAQFFIMATILVSKQIYYALHKDLGFKKDAVVVIGSPWKNRMANSRVFAEKLRAIPQIELVSIGYEPPSSTNVVSTEATYRDGKKEIKISELNEKFGDENYIKVYHLKLLAGRNVQQSDTSKAFVINNTYAKLIGFKNPQNAVGKMIDNYNGDKRMQIVGVVADFYQTSLHSPIKPLAILYGNNDMNGTFHIALKPQSATGDDWKKAIAAMEKAWKDIYPDDDFEYHFFDEKIAKFYESEQHTSTLLSWATGLSIFISCLGLLGLAMYTTGQRTKEIGVRKVLGASVAQIVKLLSTEMVWLILLAFALVTPLAWYAMNQWMQSFADRTTISWWIFVLSGAGMLLTALITSSFQTISAALANPTKSLRSE